LEFRTWKTGDLPLAMQLWGDPAVTSFVAAQPFTPPQVEERLEQEIAAAGGLSRTTPRADGCLEQSRDSSGRLDFPTIG
jgi:hypothetical protein